MYRVSVQQHFDAAHYLRGYQGKCEELHGHRFQAVVTVESSQLNDVVMAFDFSELKGERVSIFSVEVRESPESRVMFIP